MSNNDFGIRLLAMAETAGPRGFSVTDIADERVRRTYNVCQRLVRHGLLHPGKAGHRTVRLFARREWALSYEQLRQSQKERKEVVAKNWSWHARWAPDTPTHYPLRADGTPAYKFTVCPSRFDAQEAQVRNVVRWNADKIVGA